MVMEETKKIHRLINMQLVTRRITICTFGAKRTFLINNVKAKETFTTNSSAKNFIKLRAPGSIINSKQTITGRTETFCLWKGYKKTCE